MDLVTSSKISICSNILKNKVVILFIFIILFSIVYLFLDDKHFSGVNFIKDAIKEEVIKKKIEKNIKTTLPAEGFSLELPPAFTFKKNNNKSPEEQREVDKKIDKVAVDTEKEVEEEDLAVDNIENTFTQKFFERVYFSIITSTLLGYGDIYPITNLSKSIVMVQSLLTISLIII
jgi:hypothetical protein